MRIAISNTRSRLKLRSRCGTSCGPLLLLSGVMTWLVSGLAIGNAVAQGNAAAAPVTATEASAGQTIAGRVISSVDGHPLANARVVLTPQLRNGRRPAGPPAPAQPFAAAQTAQTDAEGRYRLIAPAPGRYTLRATAPGYLGALYLQHENFSTAIVTGTGLPTDNLVFPLVPEASLHGRILDDTGEPVRASVTLYREGGDGPQPVGLLDGGSPRFRLANGLQSDEDGQYEFANLQPGRYYVAVTASPWYAVHPHGRANENALPYRTSIDSALDVAYPVTFFPHATTEQEAVPIDLKPGGRASANIVLQAEPAVTLTIQMPPTDGGPQAGRQGFPALISKVFGSEQGVGAMSSRQGDTVVFSGLAPGQYAMRAMGRFGMPNAETPVSLSAGGASVSMPTGNAGATDLDVTMRTSTGTPLDDSAGISLRRVGIPARGDNPASGRLEHGVAHFSDVQPGQYRLAVQQDGQTWIVSRLTVAGKVVPSKLLRVDGSNAPAEVLLSRYSPEVDGEVHAPDGKPHAGSLVVLVPAGADSGEDLYRADQSDLDGGFQFYGVLPGDYLLVALDGNWKLDWHNSTALLPYLTHAVPLTVPASGSPVIKLQEPVIVQQK